MIAAFRRVSRRAAPLGVALALAWAYAAGAAVLRHGTIKFTGTVSITSGIPASTAINGTVQVRGAGVRSISVDAKLIRSGNTATVTVAIPYSWALDSVSTPSGKHLNVTFNVNVSGGASSSTSITLPMPADGASTTIAIPISI